jgi:hypothetical protein
MSSSALGGKRVGSVMSALADSKSKNAELKRGIIGLRDCWNKMEAEGNPNNAPPPGPSFYAQCVDEMLAELKERPE